MRTAFAQRCNVIWLQSLHLASAVGACMSIGRFYFLPLSKGEVIDRSLSVVRSTPVALCFDLLWMLSAIACFILTLSRTIVPAHFALFRRSGLSMFLIRLFILCKKSLRMCCICLFSLRQNGVTPFLVGGMIFGFVFFRVRSASESGLLIAFLAVGIIIDFLLTQEGFTIEQIPCTFLCFCNKRVFIGHGDTTSKMVAQEQSDGSLLGQVFGSRSLAV